MSRYISNDTFETLYLSDMKDYRVIEFVRNFMPGLDDTFGLKIICVGRIFTITQSKNARAIDLMVEIGSNKSGYWIFDKSLNMVIELVETATGMSISEFTYGTMDYRDELKLVSPGVSAWLVDTCKYP